jgi:hypothetical protein
MAWVRGRVPHVCRISHLRRAYGPQDWPDSITWSRIYVGRDPGNSETQVHLKIHLSWTAASTDHLYRMLAERDLSRNIHSSRQTVGQYLDHWLSITPGTKIGFGRSRDDHR